MAAVLGRNLGRRLRPSPELLAILTRLHNKTRETCYLSGWYQGGIAVQDYIPGLYNLNVGNLDAGYTANMNARASCKAILAFMPESRPSTLFRGLELTRLTPHTITNYDDLLINLASVRKQNYATDRQEFLEDVSCISSAFFPPPGRLPDPSPWLLPNTGSKKLAIRLFLPLEKPQS